MTSPLKAVLEVSLVFARERNLGRLLQLIIEKAIEITATERGCIALSEGDLLLPKAAVGIRPEEGERISSTLAREVLNGRAPLMWEDLPLDHKVGRASSILKQQLRSAMCAPLLVGGKVLGVLYVDSTTRGHYTSADLEVFQALASQAAMAIENAQLFQEVITDALTGLYSAAIFYRRLNEEVDRHLRYGRPLGLILADLNGLQEINDLHGPQAGDRALLTVAGILRSCIRSNDLPFRYGGDEFAILMPETPREATAALLEGLRTASTAISAREVSGWRGISLGLATCPDDGDNAVSLISAASSRLYEMKRAEGLLPPGAR